MYNKPQLMRVNSFQHRVTVHRKIAASDFGNKEVMYCGNGC